MHSDWTILEYEYKTPKGLMDGYLRKAFHKGVPPLFVTIKKLYTDPFKVRVCLPRSKIFFAHIVILSLLCIHSCSCTLTSYMICEMYISICDFAYCKIHIGCQRQLCNFIGFFSKLCCSKMTCQRNKICKKIFFHIRSKVKMCTAILDFWSRKMRNFLVRPNLRWLMYSWVQSSKWSSNDQ
jgi:hypothetical protein